MSIPVPIERENADVDEKRDIRVQQARAVGEHDGRNGNPMSTEYVDRVDAGLGGIEKLAYAKAYVKAREQRGRSRKTKKSKSGKRKASRHKTRGVKSRK